MDPGNDHADLVARLQGVRPLSVVFCPQLQTGKGLLQAACVAISFIQWVDEDALHTMCLLPCL